MEQTKLEFTYRDKEYTLAFTIDVVKKLDRAGVIAQIPQHPLTIVEDLFVAAFDAYHSEVSNRIRRDIYKEFSDSSDDGSLIDVLADMISEVQKAMAPSGNVSWKVKKSN